MVVWYHGGGGGTGNMVVPYIYYYHTILESYICWCPYYLVVPYHHTQTEGMEWYHTVLI